MSAELLTVEFEPQLPADDDDSVPKGLHVQLMYAPTQPAAQGLQFQVVLRNDSSRTRKLHNPYDVLTYVLGDAEGWPLGPAAPASRLKLNPKRSNVAKRLAYLDVTGITIEDRALSTDEVAAELESNTVAIAGQQRYTYHLAIRQAHPAHDHPDLVELAPGSYQLRAMLLVRTANFRPASSVLGTANLSIQLT